jgi:hypothetical protein
VPLKARGASALPCPPEWAGRGAAAGGTVALASCSALPWRRRIVATAADSVSARDQGL